MPEFHILDMSYSTASRPQPTAVPLGKSWLRLWALLLIFDFAFNLLFPYLLQV